MATTITDSNFEELIQKSTQLCVIDFWAEWCGPCRIICPVIDEIAKENETNVIVGKVNVDENTALSVKFSIRSIPTILFIKNGEIIDKISGVQSKSNIQKKIDELK